MIAGSGRSGTTWVLDVIAASFRLRPIFEPLHPGAVPAASPYAWKCVTRGQEPPGMEEFFRQIFSGQVSGLWTDIRLHREELFPDRHYFSEAGSLKLLLYKWAYAVKQYGSYLRTRKNQHIIVKFIRANLLLGWLAEHFDAKILLLVRHPGAVVESKLRIGGVIWDPEPVLRLYRRDDCILSLGDGRYRELLSRPLTRAQGLALLWCIENQTPIAEAAQNGYLVVHYENLVDRGDVAWDDIAEFFSLTAANWDDALLRRPSQQASSFWRKERRKERRNPSSHQGWMRRIGATDLQDIDMILRATDERRYNVLQPLPETGLSAARRQTNTRSETTDVIPDR